jgi:hypothetical protein
LASSSTRLRLAVQPGPVLVRVRWSRWLSVSGPACLARDGAQVQLRVRSPGTVELSSSLWPRGHC